ncbi:hypothetical protein HOY82DRAFT_331937 [Tuber indicum]|nr:hypothetical protein HOY82DRAFT_331937 [Tuber indicum]
MRLQLPYTVRYHLFLLVSCFLFSFPLLLFLHSYARLSPAPQLVARGGGVRERGLDKASGFQHRTKVKCCSTTPLTSIDNSSKWDIVIFAPRQEKIQKSGR